MLKINEVERIYLGIQGENNARPITIDVSPWIALYPNGSVTIWHKRNGDSVPEATGAVYDSETMTVTWTPDDVDTYVDGEGDAEIRLTDTNVIKKSKWIKTCVSPSVTLAGTTLGSDWASYINAVDSLRAGAVTAKNAAVTAKNAAETAESNAEAWAVGQRGGEDVESTDPAYQNNAKYYKEQAAGSASTASTASTAAVAAKNAAVAAQGAAEVAQLAAVTAQGKAETAQAAAENAQSAAESAQSSAETAKTGAISAKNDAISAKNDAVSAKNDAVSAKNDAENSATTASTKAGEAATSATTASTKAGEAATSATTASTKANEAAASAGAAAASAAAAAATTTMIAPAFAEATANDPGTYVTKDGVLYLLPAGHEANVTWANTTKEEVKVGSELIGLKSAITNAHDDILSLAGVGITWEVGTIGGVNGQDSVSTNRLRTKTYIPLSVFVKATQHGNGSFKFFAYDSNLAYLGTADWTQTYMESIEKSSIMTTYPTAVYVRILWRWISEAATTLDDIQRADLRIVQNTYKAKTDADIDDLKNSVKKKCGLITNSGRIFTADMLTITGTNTTVKDDGSTVFSKTAKRIFASADAATVKLSLGGSYAFDTVTVVFYLPYDSYKGDSPTALDLRIYANATTNTPIVSASNCCWGWNYLKIPRNKMGLGQSLVISSIDMVFKKTSGTTETNFGEIVVDSIILDMEMKPTFILDFDQIWEKSIDNGAYDYCRTNNIPYTVHTYQFQSLNAAKLAEMKKAMLNGCEFSYYGGFTSAGELTNATDYSDAIAECNLMENDMLTATHRRFLTYGCGAHLMNPILRESLEASGVKAIRGRWTQNPVGYFSEKSTWLPYSIEISYGNSTHEDMTNHIYEALTHGSCVVAFTHGVCNDDEDHLGSSSSAIRISDFKYLIDHLVSLRSQGKIQICTMEQFVNQCLG